ncbi:MAG: hypothetical protein ACTSPD_09425 [Promethearchaeota archaeon]
MIRKLLLIGESGLLPFYLSQDNIEIDNDMLSGFCRAIHGISIELTFPLKNIGFENHRMIIENLKHESNRGFLIAALYDEYHIDEGVKNKINYIFNKYFKNYKNITDCVRINNEELKINILNVLNDEPLKNLLFENIEIIRKVLDPVLYDSENNIYAYSLNSSNNNILFFNGTEDIIKNRQGEKISDVIKEYLQIWDLEKVPHGDYFTGAELPTGLDLKDYCETGQKTHGIVINTSINLREEPDNELLLYFFGKNMLMRSCVPNIEETLRKLLKYA